MAVYFLLLLLFHNSNIVLTFSFLFTIAKSKGNLTLSPLRAQTVAVTIVGRTIIIWRGIKKKSAIFSVKIIVSNPISHSKLINNNRLAFLSEFNSIEYMI